MYLLIPETHTLMCRSSITLKNNDRGAQISEVQIMEISLYIDEHDHE